MSVHGSAEDLALAGGTAARGIAVALGSADVDARGPAHVVRFASVREDPGELLVAPDGDDLWRRAPWPAADDLFALPEPQTAAILVAGGDDSGRAALAQAAAERGVEVRSAGRLRRADLEAVATVVLLEPAATFPPHAFAVAAAARLLVLHAPGVAFGLQDGVDCLMAGSGDRDVLDLIDTAATYSADFDAVRRVARVTAAAQRASEVYARLATDVELGLVGVARNPRSAAST